MENLFGYLSARPYPGRGILIGSTRSGTPLAAYFIMGRSENSRNRVFIRTEDGIRTSAFDPAKLSNPSLVIYHPVREYAKKLIVTNGDQTDTIWEFLKSGKSARDALMTRCFEPDPPNFTPRISAVLDQDGSLCVSILKTPDEGTSCCRYFYDYEAITPGSGYFISTYEGFGTPLPSFFGEPLRVELPELEAAAFAEKLWNSLDAENRVSLWLRAADGTVVINGNET